MCFLTDGYIGNETEILGEIHQRLDASRIFSFGIGSSVNRYLIDHMAKAGRGAVAYLGPKDSASQIMEDFFARIIRRLPTSRSTGAAFTSAKFSLTRCRTCLSAAQ